MHLLTAFATLLLFVQLVGAVQLDQTAQPRLVKARVKRAISGPEQGNRSQHGMKQRRALAPVGELIEKFGGKATAAEKGKGIAAVSEAASDLGSPGSSSAKTFLQSPGHTAYAHSYESMPANPSVHWQESHAADPENPWYAMSKHQSVLEDHQQELRFHRSAIGDGETAVRQNRKHIQELAQNNAELQAKVAQIKSNSPGRWSGKGRDLLAWTAFGTAGAVAVTSGLHNKQHAEQAEAESKQISELRAEVAKLKGSQGRPTPTYVNGPSVGQEGVAAFNAGAGGGLV